jgi:hypothetical protein
LIAQIDSKQSLNIFIAIGAIVLLSLLEYRLVILLHIDDINKLIQAAEGVTIGEPHWRVYKYPLGYFSF